VTRNAARGLRVLTKGERRRFSPTVLSTLTLACVVTLSGCTKVGTAGAGSGNPWTKPGVLRMTSLGDPDTLNPVVGNQQIDTDLSMLWGGYLFNVDDHFKFVPELATEFPTLRNGGISRDARTIVYHLRRGVLWQDGAPFGADDVIFTWRAVMNSRNNVGSRVGYDLITRIDKRDDHTIAVHLKHANAPFVASFFTMSGNAYPVLPAHLLAKYPDLNRIAYNQQPIGTGPFTIDRWQRGQKIVFRANPRYWRGRPKLDRIEYSIVPDEITILTQMQAHELDLWFNAPSPQIASIQRLTGVRVYLTPFTGFTQIGLNLRNPALSDLRVRQALAYAIDVDRLIVEVTHGVHIRGDSDQPAFSWAHADGLPRYDYEPARARLLLDAAGWKVGEDGYRYKNGKKLTLVISSSSGSATANETEVLVQRDWRAVGVDAIVKNYVSSLFFASYGAGGILQGGKFDAAFFAWYNGVDPDDSTQFMCNQMPPAGQNVYGLCDAGLDNAERLAVNSNDQAERKQAYDAIQRRLVVQEPLIIMWFVRRIDVANTDLRNFKPAHAVTDFWNSWEWQI
jgi:peptide/nickel transport system substrate-binding protein